MTEEKLTFARLSQALLQDLQAITPSVDGGLYYWPCAARMKNGVVLTCVFVVAEPAYLRHWGIYPQHDPGKSYILVEGVEAFAESPRRLPVRYANQLYEQGETGMGYTIFTVEFADGYRQAYSSGNAVDFIRYPEGLSGDDVKAVYPHEGRSGTPIRVPEYYWCLFSGEPPNTSG